MKKIGLICIVVIAMVGIIFTISCGGYGKDNVDTVEYVTSDSKVVKYKNNLYQIIPSDMIGEHKECADILDGLKLEYKPSIDDVGIKIKDLEEGGSLYMTKYQDNRVFVVKDYNDEYVYAFKIH